MKKYFSSTIVTCLFGMAACAQLSIQPTVPSVGLIQKNQLWNVLVINSSATSYECKINLSLKDRFTGQDVLTAVTGNFTVGTGTKQLNSGNLNPIQYNYVSPSADTRIEGLMTVGSYTACYTLSVATGKMELADYCIDFDVEPLTSPMLAFPADSERLENAPTQFGWTPPTPMGMFSNLHYEIMITEINEGQKPQEAIQQNLPFYSNGNVINSSFNYSGTGQDFEKNKWYAWQVVARDNNNYAGKSETWVFSINNPSIIKTIIEQAPFLKMKRSNPQKGLAPNGILKLSYVNETTDSIAQINIIDLNSPGKTKMQISVPVQRGENLIQYDLNKVFHPEEGKVYEAQIVNSRKEKWMMQFECHNYKNKDSRD